MRKTEPPVVTSPPNPEAGEEPGGAPLPNEASALAGPNALRHVGHRLNLTRLRYFVAVAQELHFGRAARKLGISQPPLSLHVQALEREVGAALFHRINRQVSLTSAGRILLGQARALLDHAQRVEQVMRGVGSGERGELLVGCVPSAMYDVLPRILTRFRAAHADVSLVLEEGHTMDVMNAVQEGRLDVGLVWRNQGGRNLGLQPILREKFIALAPAGHPLSSRRDLSLDDLASQPLILPPRRISPYHYDHVVSAFARQGLSPRIEYEVATILSQVGYVASGFGIAITPSFASRFTTDRVALLPIAEDMPPVILSAVWNRQRPAPVVDLFRKVVREVFAEDEIGSPPSAAS
jgi:DNA-binding transcriptional LysR family regulator